MNGTESILRESQFRISHTTEKYFFLFYFDNSISFRKNYVNEICVNLYIFMGYRLSVVAR